MKYLLFNPHYWQTVGKNYDSLNSGLEYILNIDKKTFEVQKSRSSNNQIESLFKNRLGSLSREIQKIFDLLQERIRLNRHLNNRFDHAVLSYKDIQHNLDFWASNINQVVEQQRSNLDKICVGIEKERNKEERDCWQDFVSLSRDLRALLREYSELKIKNELLK